MLKQGDYEMWRLKIKQYFQVQDYALWDVIENGNAFKPVAQTTTNDAGTSTTHIPGPVTTDEKAQKKNDVKAHLMTFNQYKDAKTLFAAIETRFGGNEAIKKTQKTLLKNKSDLDTMSIDDLYKNFKIVDQEVKGTTNTNSSSQNMAFVSSPSFNSTNEVLTTYGVSTASTQSSTASTQVSTTNLSDATVYAFLSNQSNRSQLVHEDLEQIYKDDIEEIDLKWQLALLSMRAKRVTEAVLYVFFAVIDDEFDEWAWSCELTSFWPAAATVGIPASLSVLAVLKSEHLKVNRARINVLENVVEHFESCHKFDSWKNLTSHLPRACLMLALAGIPSSL
nr:hypothetical protein [Tanacetum cinerariifolium]